VTGLWAVFGSFCPWGRLKLGPEVTHCQFLQVVRSVVVFTRLQLWLVSSSPSKVAQFSFEYCPQSHKTNSVFLLWEVGLLPYSHSQPLLLFPPCSLSVQLLALPPFSVTGSAFHPPFLSVLDYNSLFMLFSFVQGGFNLPKGYAGVCSQGVGRGVMCCSPVGSAGLRG
jgi:hypothetical protein